VADAIDDLLAELGGQGQAAASSPQLEKGPALDADIDSLLNQFMTKDGDMRPEYARGDSVDTPLNESPLDAVDRLRYSTLWGNKERIARALKEEGKFQDVQINEAGNVVMLDKDGAWKAFDPNNSAWETTKNLVTGNWKRYGNAVLGAGKKAADMVGLGEEVKSGLERFGLQDGFKIHAAEREALNDLADAAPEIAIQTALAALTMGTSLPAAGGAIGLKAGLQAGLKSKLALKGAEWAGEGALMGAASASGRAALSSLGRLAGTYTATPEEQVSDGLLEMGLMAAGTPIFMGVSGALGAVKNGLVNLGKKSAESEFGKKLMGGYIQGISPVKGNEVVEYVMQQPGHLSRFIDRIEKAPLTKEVGFDGAADQMSMKYVVRLMKNSKQQLADASDALAEKLIKNYPENIQVDNKIIFRPLQKEMAAAGFIRGKTKDGALLRGENLIKALDDGMSGLQIESARKLAHVVENIGEGGVSEALAAQGDEVLKPLFSRVRDLNDNLIGITGNRVSVGRSAVKARLKSLSELRLSLSSEATAASDAGQQVFSQFLQKAKGSLDEGFGNLLASETNATKSQALKTYFKEMESVFTQMSPFLTANKQYFSPNANRSAVLQDLFKTLGGVGTSNKAAGFQNQLPQLVKTFERLGLKNQAGFIKHNTTRLMQIQAAKAFSKLASPGTVRKVIQVAGGAVGLGAATQIGDASDVLSGAGLGMLGGAGTLALLSPRINLAVLNMAKKTGGRLNNNAISKTMLNVVNNARNRVGTKTFQKILANPAARDALFISILNSGVVKPIVQRGQ
jgi:hypothetical protein